MVEEYTGKKEVDDAAISELEHQVAESNDCTIRQDCVCHEFINLIACYCR